MDLSEEWLEECVTRIEDSHSKVVALQFPEHMLNQCSRILDQLKSRVSAETLFQVLADSTYSECCVDEVAAEHAGGSCDVILHFGHSCYSRPSRVASLVVPPPSSVVLCDASVQACVQFVRSQCSQHCEASIFISDSYYYQLYSIISNASIKCCTVGQLESYLKPSEEEQNLVFGRNFPVDHKFQGCIIYIGSESDRLLSLLSLKFYVNCRMCAFDVDKGEISTDALIRRLSLKRSHLIERVKEADIFGILVGTLGVRSYAKAIAHARKLIKIAGKKCYCFVVGKINVAKLANYAEIEVFVLISCPETALNDHSEFYKPVVSLCELDLGLNPFSHWDGSFDLDFASVAKNPLPDIKEDDESQDRTLAVRENLELVPKTAASFLAKRSWQGLETNLGQDPPAKIEPGLSGIPAKYVSEPSNSDQLSF